MASYMVARQSLEAFVRQVLETKARLVDDVVEGRALADDMTGDVVAELRRLVAHLDAVLADAHDAEAVDPAAAEALLREASERYLRRNAGPEAALRPAAEAAVRALASALAGPERTVYLVASASNPNASYRLEVVGPDVACDCKGFGYRGMCRHARALKDALASGQPLPVAYRRLEDAA